MSESGYKACSKCLTSKIVGEFPFDKQRGRWGTVCKACQTSRQRTWRRQNKDRVNEQKRQRAKDAAHRRKDSDRVARWKQRKRGEDPQKYYEKKALETFKTRATQKGVSLEEYLAGYRERQRLRVERARERERLRIRPLKQLECPVLRSETKKADQRARARDYYWRNHKKSRLRVRKWKKQNPGLVSQQRYRRRVRRESLPNTLTSEEWAAIKTAYRHRCAYCGRRKQLTMDHIVAVSKGGHHSAGNIIPACLSCNASKGNREAGVVYQPHLFT